MAFRFKLTHKDGTRSRVMGRLRYSSAPRIGETIKVRHAGKFMDAQVTEVAVGKPTTSDYISDKVQVVSVREIELAEE
jgi:hypothetical protein